MSNIHAVVFDIDEVAISWVAGFRAWMTKQGFPPAAEVTSWDMLGAWPMLTRDGINARVEEFNRSPGFLHLQPVEGAQEAIEKLRQALPGTIFAAVTCCGAHPLTQAWRLQQLWIWFARVFDEVQMLPLGADKSQALARFAPPAGKVSVMIEDNASHAATAVSQGLDAVLLARPWNEGVRPSCIARAESWPGIVDHVLALDEPLRRSA